MARPVQFDRDQVLERAMNAFWDKGYCATSMSRLIDATGLRPGSLYAAFESKQQLFIASLERYAELSAERLRGALAENESPLSAIKAYFGQLADTIDSDEGWRGCLLVNTALELARRDQTIQEQVDSHFRAIKNTLKQGLKKAQGRGEISPESDIDDLADFLMNTIWGLRVLAATSHLPGRAHAIVKQALKTLNTP